MTCNGKTLFDSSMTSVIMSQLRQIIKHNTSDSAEGIYKKIIEYLNKQEIFTFGTESSSKIYSDSITLLQKSILTGLEPIIRKKNTKYSYDEFKSQFDSNFLSDSGVKSGSVKNNTDPETPYIENNSELINEEERVKQKLDDVIDSYYGTVIKANSMRKVQFGQDLVRSAIIDVTRGTIIRTTQDLNKALCTIKNLYLDRIISYIRSVDPNFSYDSKLYDDNFQLVSGYEQVLNKFYNILKGKREDGSIESQVTEGWKKRLNGQEDLFYDALNSYVNLVYFDEMLQDTIGKTIQLADPSYSGVELDASFEKYVFSKGDEHKRKGWETSENRNALNDIAKFSKLIISIIPMYSSVSGKFLNRYLNIGNFANAITSLFTRVYDLGDNYLALQEAIGNFHSNPYYYSGIIFKEISNTNTNIQKALISVGVNRFNIDVLTSVFKFVYDLNNKNSIKSIETNSLKKRFSIDGYSIIDSINGVIDRTMDATYLQATYSRDDEVMTITPKKKWQSRRTSYNTINRINIKNYSRQVSDRRNLSKRFSVTYADVINNEAFDSSYQTVSIKIGNTIITGKTSSDYGILSPKNISLTFSNPRIQEIFSSLNETIDLVKQDSIQKIIEGRDLTEDEQLFRDIIEFIDSFLDTNFLTKDGLEKLFLLKSVNSNTEIYIKSLLESAIRSSVVNDLYLRFAEELERGARQSILDFEAFLKESYSPFAKLDFKDRNEYKTYFVNNIGIPELLSVRTSEEWVDQLSDLEAILTGEVSKSTTKDINGNSIANNRTSFLGNNLKYYINKYRRAGQKAATSSLLFTQNPRLLHRTVINTDAQSRLGIKKSVKDMKAAELFYTSIIYNFYGSYLQDKTNPKKFGSDKKNSLKGDILVQATTFSDKTSIVTHGIKGNQALRAIGKSYDGKTIWELNRNEILDLYQDTIGVATQNMYNQVLGDLKAVLTTLKAINQREGKVNPELDRYMDLSNLTAEEINDILHSVTQEELLNAATEANINLYLDTHYRKFGKYCKFNELLYHYATDLYVNRDSLIRRFENEKTNFLNDLLLSGVNFWINYRDDSRDNFRKNESSSIVTRIIDQMYKDKAKEAFLKSWSKNGKLILAKVDGKPVTGVEIDYGHNVELNPLLEKYFYTDSLLSNNLRLELTGSEVAHPDKAKINFTDELRQSGITPELNPGYFKRNPLSNPNNRVIYAHPGIGKSFSENGLFKDRFVDWDTRYNKLRDNFIATYYNVVKGTPEFDAVKNTLLSNPESNPDYLAFLDEQWYRIKDEVMQEGKILLVSPHYLLRRHANEFDAIIDMDSDDFVMRNVSRGANNYSNSVKWKQGIDRSIESARNIVPEVYTIQKGKYLEDLFREAEKPEAIDNFNDIIWLKNEAKRHPVLQKIFDKAIIKIEAVAQGTQLKRNVIIPATLQYEQQGTLNGIPRKLKVAVISDTQAKIFNFRGDSAKEDAHDGSAWINPFISILENKALQDQEVGVDKKPIWHSFDPKTLSATLLKFATFTITNERMRTSLNSDISLYSLFKQMTNLQWSSIDENGNVVWNNSKNQSFDLINSKGLKQNQFDKIRFDTDILNGKRLFYEENGNHYQILDFGLDQNGYYTIEAEVNLQGNRYDSENNIKVYHAFDSESNHFKFRDSVPPKEGFHKINSLFELFNALGGIYSEELIQDENGKSSLQYTDISSYMIVNFMNNVSIRSENGNTNDLSQNTYYQPLKEMMISYAANSSAVKNGAANINGEHAWLGKTKLRYMELDADGLGIQMDADHTIDESEMTEFSQVISALEAGGRLHNRTKQVYRALGMLAVKASQVEIDAISKYIYSKNNNLSITAIMSELYDILGRCIINNYKQRDDRIELAAPIIAEIKRKFNLSNDHSLDEFLIPFSDSNIYQNTISNFVSMLNSKSIKRKYPGSGCVMVPGYNIIQTFKYDGKIKQFEDVLKEARAVNGNPETHFYDQNFEGNNIVEYNRTLVSEYLKSVQKRQTIVSSLDEFIPTDIIDVVDQNGNTIYTVDTNGIEDYYSFKENPGRYIEIRFAENGQDFDKSQIAGYRINVTRPKNLAPARIRWKYQDENGITHTTNIFDTEPVRESFLRRNDPTFDRIANRQKIQEIFDNLERGTYNGYAVTDIENKAAELIMSNLYASKFNTRGKSISEILEKGPDFFRTRRITPIRSSNYDMVFTTNNGKHAYISFKDPKSNPEDIFQPRNVGWKYTKLVKDGNREYIYATSKDGQLLYRVGENISREDLSYINGKFIENETGNEVSNSSNLIRDSKGGVVEYKEFLSNYRVVEKGRGRRPISYNVYVISAKNISDTQVKANTNSINNQIGKILSDVYYANNYNGIRLNYNMSGSSAYRIAGVIPRLRTSGNLKSLLDLTLSKYLQNIDPTKTFKINEEAYNKDLVNYYNSFAEEIFASFQKSLTFTASRIPAQTLQSFMQMELVGLTQSSKNIAYVSHWQTWLQGSDY